MDCFASLAMTRCLTIESEGPTRDIAIGHCEERKRLSFVRPNGLLRGACHRARIRATRWLAMTVENLLLIRLLAADVLELGEHGVDVEVVAAPLGGGLQLRLLAGGLGGRQQRRAAMGDVGRLFLRRALNLEIELDLRAQAERH